MLLQQQKSKGSALLQKSLSKLGSLHHLNEAQLHGQESTPSVSAISALDPFGDRREMDSVALLEKTADLAGGETKHVEIRVLYFHVIAVAFSEHGFVQRFKLPTRHIHIGVMLYMVIDPVRRDKDTCKEIGLGGAGVLQRIVIATGHGMFSDIANA